MNRPEEKRRPRGRLIPEGELTCIWMDAGIVSYKLCNHEYECERCPFDAEMRTSEIAPAGSVGEAKLGDAGLERRQGNIRLADSAPQVVRDCFYHAGHTWVLLMAEQEAERASVRIGVDGFAAAVLPRVKDAILPHRGCTIHQGQVFCWLVCGSSTMPVVAPVGGKVKGLNPRLAERPWLVNTDPHGEGWFVTVEPGDLAGDLAKLMKGRQAVSWMANERKKFDRLASLLRWPADVARAPRQAPEVGVTMADGGEELQGLFDDARSKRYMEFIVQFFL